MGGGCWWVGVPGAGGSEAFWGEGDLTYEVVWCAGKEWVAPAALALPSEGMGDRWCAGTSSSFYFGPPANSICATSARGSVRTWWLVFPAFSSAASWHRSRTMLSSCAQRSAYAARMPASAASERWVDASWPAAVASSLVNTALSCASRRESWCWWEERAEERDDSSEDWEWARADAASTSR
eukprot:scaffold9894_cov118-Isochrysis_galbana.AAC.1